MTVHLTTSDLLARGAALLAPVLESPGLDAGFLLAIFLIFERTGTLQYESGPGGGIFGQLHHLDGGYGLAAVLLLFLAAAGKSGDIAQWKAPFGAVADACDNCHDVNHANPAAVKAGSTPAGPPTLQPVSARASSVTSAWL